jgi:hypothetical protein
MKYRTKSGSLYEVDVEARRVRTLEGGTGTSRIVQEWRAYDTLELTDDGRLLIVWGYGRDEVSDQLGTPQGVDPCRMTTTSPVVEAVP